LNRGGCRRHSPDNGPRPKGIDRPAAAPRRRGRHKRLLSARPGTRRSYAYFFSQGHAQRHWPRRVGQRKHAARRHIDPTAPAGGGNRKSMARTEQRPAKHDIQSDPVFHTSCLDSLHCNPAELSPRTEIVDYSRPVGSAPISARRSPCCQHKAPTAMSQRTRQQPLTLLRVRLIFSRGTGVNPTRPVFVSPEGAEHPLRVPLRPRAQPAFVPGHPGFDYRFPPPNPPSVALARNSSRLVRGSTKIPLLCFPAPSSSAAARPARPSSSEAMQWFSWLQGAF